MFVCQKIEDYKVKKQLSPKTFILEADSRQVVAKLVELPNTKQNLHPLLHNLPLQHKSVSQPFDILTFENGSECFHAELSEFFPEGNLAQQLGKFNNRRIKDLCIQLAESIAYLHHKNIGKLGIKLENIYTKEGSIRVASGFLRPSKTQGAETDWKDKKSVLVRRGSTHPSETCFQEDISALGFLILELICCQRIESILSSCDLTDIAQFANKYLAKCSVKDLLMKMIDPNPIKRPKAESTVELLRENAFNLDYNPECYRPYEFWLPGNVQSYVLSFKNLTYLNMASSRVNDQMLAGVLKNCSKLQVLNCSNCQITSASAAAIVQLKQLNSLDVSGTGVNNDFLKNIRQLLPQLVSLNLCFTNITDQGVTLLAENLSKCSRLDLSYTKLSSSAVMSLSKLGCLKSLSIWSGMNCLPRYNQYLYQNYINNLQKQECNQIELDQEAADQISYAFNLEELCANFTGIDVSRIINKMPENASRVEVAGIITNQKALKKIVSNPNLVGLYLEDIDLTEVQLASKQLQQLVLSKCKVTGSTLSRLEPEKMEFLDLSESNLDQTSLEPVLAKFSKLKYLDLTWTKVKGSFVTAVLHHTRGLRSLGLSKTISFIRNTLIDWTKITNANIIEVIRTNRSLNHLDLTETAVDDSGLLQISPLLGQLTYLSLENTPVGDRAMKDNLRCLSKLEHLNLKNTKISDETILEMRRHLCNLSYLNINKGVDHLCQMSQLSTVMIHGTKISYNGREALRAKVKHVWGTNTK